MIIQIQNQLFHLNHSQVPLSLSQRNNMSYHQFDVKQYDNHQILEALNYLHFLLIKVVDISQKHTLHY